MSLLDFAPRNEPQAGPGRDVHLTMRLSADLAGRLVLAVTLLGCLYLILALGVTDPDITPGIFEAKARLSSSCCC